VGPSVRLKDDGSQGAGYCKRMLASKAPLEEKQQACAEWNTRYLKTIKPKQLSIPTPTSWKDYCALCIDKFSFKSNEEHNKAIGRYLSGKPEIKTFSSHLSALRLYNNTKLVQLEKMVKYLPDGHEDLQDYGFKINLFKNSYRFGDYFMTGDQVGLNI